MHVIKNREIAELDWEFHCEAHSLSTVPDEGNIIFPFEIFEENRQLLLSRSGKTGIIIDGFTSIESINKELSALPLIALHFPKFADGRCFSHARLLRMNHGYNGDLLAFGDILRDQIADMERCGINIIKYPDNRDINDALEAFGELTIPYQASVDNIKTISNLR